MEHEVESAPSDCIRQTIYRDAMISVKSLPDNMQENFVIELLEWMKKAEIDRKWAYLHNAASCPK
jgi:hypothetical protein